MMQSILTRPEIIVPLAGCAVGIVAIICGSLVKIHRQSVEARLKESMIHRGMSPDEMDRVLESKLDPSDYQPSKPIASKG